MKISERRAACMCALSLSVLLTACGNSEDDGKLGVQTPVQASSHLEQAFQAAPAPIKQNITVASDAMRKGEYEKAVVSLQSVKQSESLTLDQGMAVHRSVISMERELISAMEAGDPRAKQAYELLKRMNRN